MGWEAKAQVEFNPDSVELWRLIGYENRKIDSELFREDELVKSQSAPLLGGVATAAFFEVKLADRAERNDWLVSATVRYRPCLDCFFKELNTRTPVGAVDLPFSDGVCDYRVQSYVMQYAEFARNSFYAWDRQHPRHVGGCPLPRSGHPVSGRARILRTGLGDGSANRTQVPQRIPPGNQIGPSDQEEGGGTPTRPLPYRRPGAPCRTVISW